MKSLEIEKEELITRFRNLEDMRILKAIRALLDHAVPPVKKPRLASVFGSINAAEARELENIIKDGCEGIDSSGW